MENSSVFLAFLAIVTAVSNVWMAYETRQANRHYARANVIAEGGATGVSETPYKPSRLPQLTMLLLTILTWAAVGYDIYDRIATARGAAAVSGIIEQWGNPGNICTASIDGTHLTLWANKYEVALICGVNEPPTDRYQARSISVGALHVIRPESIPIEAARSADMSSAIAKWARELISSAAKPPPNERTVGLIPIWHEIVLFPTNSDLSNIHRLADVSSYGGKILSQEFPACCRCSATFMSQEAPE